MQPCCWNKDLLQREINYLIVANNGDAEKVLATIVGALYKFFDKNPDAFVYATEVKSQERGCIGQHSPFLWQND